MANYLLDFLSDPAERSKIRQGFMDAVNRGAIATTLGAPADMLNLGANALRAGYGYAGHKLGLLSADQMPALEDKLPLGSEWLGDKMQQYGMVSGNRNALAEGFAGSLAVTPQQSARMVAGVALPGLADAGMGKAMFIGPTAKTWDKAAAATAQKLEKAGTDARAIWSEAGTIRGVDGEWRQEISDHGAKLRDYNYTPQEAFKEQQSRAFIDDGPRDKVNAMRPYAGMTKTQLTDEYKRTGGQIVDAAVSGDKAKAMQLSADRGGLDAIFDAMRDRAYGPASSYLNHGELGAAYPDVYKLHTRTAGDLGGGTTGQYLRGNEMQGEQVVLGSKPSTWNDGKSTMLHELQHAIQQREGFAMGGSPGDMPLIFEDLAARNEARATQARMNMTPDERRATFPYDSYDVPVNQLIVRSLLD